MSTVCKVAGSKVVVLVVAMCMTAAGMAHAELVAEYLFLESAPNADTSGYGNDIVSETGANGVKSNPYDPSGDSSTFHAFAAGAEFAIDDSASLDTVDTQFSFSGWVRLTSNGAMEIFRNLGTDASWVIYAQAYKLLFAPQGYGEIYNFYAGSSLEWIHFAITFDDTTDEAAFYVNGVDVTADAVKVPTGWTTDKDITPNDGQIMLGYISGSRGPFIGTADNFRLYNHVLTLEEVQRDYARHASVRVPTTCAESAEFGLMLSADLNQDCYVEWADFGIFASQWQECTDPEQLDNGCHIPW